MKKLMVLTAILSMVNLSGCSWSQIRYGETKPQVTFVDLNNNRNDQKSEGAQIFAWSPKNNAAIVRKDGKGKDVYKVQMFSMKNQVV